MKKYIEYILFKIFELLIRIMPLKLAQRFGKNLGRFASFILTKRMGITIDNLRNAFPEKSTNELKIIATKVFENLGISITELLWFPNLNQKIISKLVNYKNLEKMIDRYKEGKGVIMLSGHFGNWELLALATGCLSKIPLTIIVKTQANLWVDKIVNQHRTLFGNKVVPMEFSVREILSTLNKGGIVAMVADQSAAKESIFVEFFGRQVATFQGPAVFALRTGAPVQMVIITRNSDYTYDVLFEEIVTSDLTEYNEENIFELTRRHTLILEKYIRLFPDHWMWTHRRWKNIMQQPG